MSIKFRSGERALEILTDFGFVVETPATGNYSEIKFILPKARLIAYVEGFRDEVVVRIAGTGNIPYTPIAYPFKVDSDLDGFTAHVRDCIQKTSAQNGVNLDQQDKDDALYAELLVELQAFKGIDTVERVWANSDATITAGKYELTVNPDLNTHFKFTGKEHVISLNTALKMINMLNEIT